MGKYSIEVKQFDPHPEGNYEGRIIAFEDRGIIEEEYNGEKKVNHVFLAKIESETAVSEDGIPYTVTERYNLSSDPRSKLYKLRQTMFGRKMTAEELRNFDEEEELIGRRVGYIVVQKKGDNEGVVFANIDSIWPLKDQEPQR